MKICHNCGFELEDNAFFCSECGTKQAEQKKFCPECGTEIIPKAKFCIECGTPVASGSTKPAGTNSDNKSASDNIKNDKVEINCPDDETIALSMMGIPFQFKLVLGKNYGKANAINDFFIAETPVTQALWTVVTDNNPSEDNSDLNFPVTNLSPSLITSFFKKLSNLFDLTFDLPTVEQWNYAYKGGHKCKNFKFSGSDNIDEVGWQDEILHPVAELYGNELGITDMDGNVMELLKNGKKSPYAGSKGKTLKDRDNITGFRMILNIPENLNQGSKTLQSLLKNLHPKLVDLRKQRESEAEASFEKEVEKLEASYQPVYKKFKKEIEKYKKESLIEYDYDDYDNMKKMFPLVIGKDYFRFMVELQEFKKEVEDIVNSDNYHWEPYCKYALDVDEYGEPYDTYDGGTQYLLLEDLLIIKGDQDFPDLPLPEEMEEDENYWVINEEINDAKSKIRKVAIIGGSKLIGKRCFEGFSNLELVLFPEEMEEIGSYAFTGCKFKYIDFPDGMETIYENAFIDCNDLQAILLPAELDELDEYAFVSKSLKKVALVDDDDYSDKAFAKCPKI